jgi:hypothetical protein
MKLNILTQGYIIKDIKRDDMALFPSAKSAMGVFAPKEQRIGEVASAPLFEGRWVFFWWPPKIGGGIRTLLEHEN